MINKIINKIKLGLKFKKKVILTRLNNKELNLIKTLIKINLIKYAKRENTYYKIYLNYYNEQPLFHNLINLNKNSKPLYISYKTIKYLTYKYNYIFLINSNKGVITNYEALYLKIGGLLIIKLWN